MAQTETNAPATSEGQSGDVDLGTDVTSEELKEFCLEEVASYKHPREVEFIDELPRTTSGKVQKYKLEKGEE